MGFRSWGFGGRQKAPGVDLGRRSGWKVATAALLVWSLAGPVQAQFFFKVYPYGTADAGAIEVSYWTTFIASSEGELEFRDGRRFAREDLWAHSLELEYGLSHKLTIGYYADFLHPEQGSFQYIQSKLLARYRLFEKHELPVDLALYGEYILPNRDYSNAEKIELRLIIERDIGPWRLALNPMFEKVVSGTRVDRGLEFAYAAGIYYENMGDGLWQTRNLHVVPGLEFYGSIGKLAAADGWNQRRHYVFPVIDLFLPFYGDWKLHWNFGPGFGISAAAAGAGAGQLLGPRLAVAGLVCLAGTDATGSAQRGGEPAVRAALAQ